MSENTPYPLGFFDVFVGHKLEIDCSSWEYEFAAQKWGPNLAGKTTEGIITKSAWNCYRRTGKPKFEVRITELNETYTNYDLDYILKYSVNVPAKYSELKAEYIVRKAREAGMLLHRREADTDLEASENSLSIEHKQDDADREQNSHSQSGDFTSL